MLTELPLSIYQLHIQTRLSQNDVIIIRRVCKSWYSLPINFLQINNPPNRKVILKDVICTTLKILSPLDISYQSCKIDNLYLRGLSHSLFEARPLPSSYESTTICNCQVTVAISNSWIGTDLDDIKICKQNVKSLKIWIYIIPNFDALLEPPFRNLLENIYNLNIDFNLSAEVCYILNLPNVNFITIYYNVCSKKYPAYLRLNTPNLKKIRVRGKIQIERSGPQKILLDINSKSLQKIFLGTHALPNGNFEPKYLSCDSMILPQFANYEALSSNIKSPPSDYILPKVIFYKHSESVIEEWWIQAFPNLQGFGNGSFAGISPRRICAKKFQQICNTSIPEGINTLQLEIVYTNKKCKIPFPCAKTVVINITDNFGPKDVSIELNMFPNATTLIITGYGYIEFTGSRTNSQINRVFVSTRKTDRCHYYEPLINAFQNAQVIYTEDIPAEFELVNKLRLQVYISSL